MPKNASLPSALKFQGVIPILDFPQPLSPAPKITVGYEHELDAFIATKRQMMH